MAVRKNMFLKPSNWLTLALLAGAPQVAEARRLIAPAPQLTRAPELVEFVPAARPGWCCGCTSTRPAR
jgi:hypothetical protein